MASLTNCWLSGTFCSFILCTPAEAVPAANAVAYNAAPFMLAVMCLMVEWAVMDGDGEMESVCKRGW